MPEEPSKIDEKEVKELTKMPRPKKYITTLIVLGITILILGILSLPFLSWAFAFSIWELLRLWLGISMMLIGLIIVVIAVIMYVMTKSE